MSDKNYEDIVQENWTPEKVDSFITGILLSIEDNVGKHKTKVYNLKQPDNSIISIWGSTVLDSKIKLVELGDDIKIIYLGVPEGKDYKDFKIQKAR